MYVAGLYLGGTMNTIMKYFVRTGRGLMSFIS